MASITEADLPGPARGRGIYTVAGALVLLAGFGAAGVAVLMHQAGLLLGSGPAPVANLWLIGSLAAAVVLLLAGGGLMFSRPGPGGGIALAGTLAYLWALLVEVNFGGLNAVPLGLGAVGSLMALAVHDRAAATPEKRRGASRHRNPSSLD